MDIEEGLVVDAAAPDELEPPEVIICHEGESDRLVWIVMYDAVGHGDDNNVVGVYASREAAAAFVGPHRPRPKYGEIGDRSSTWIEEWAVSSDND